MWKSTCTACILKIDWSYSWPIMPWWKKAEYWLTSLKQCEPVGCAVNRNTSCSSVGILMNCLLKECCPFKSGPHTKFSISAWLVYNGYNVAHAPQRMSYIISINSIYIATILSWAQVSWGPQLSEKSSGCHREHPDSSSWNHEYQQLILLYFTV